MSDSDNTEYTSSSSISSYRALTGVLRRSKKDWQSTYFEEQRKSDGASDEEEEYPFYYKVSMVDRLRTIVDEKPPTFSPSPETQHMKTRPLQSGGEHEEVVSRLDFEREEGRTSRAVWGSPPESGVEDETEESSSGEEENSGDEGSPTAEPSSLRSSASTLNAPLTRLVMETVAGLFGATDPQCSSYVFGKRFSASVDRVFGQVSTYDLFAPRKVDTSSSLPIPDKPKLSQAPVLGAFHVVLNNDGNLMRPGSIEVLSPSGRTKVESEESSPKSPLDAFSARFVEEDDAGGLEELTTSYEDSDGETKKIGDDGGGGAERKEDTLFSHTHRKRVVIVDEGDQTKGQEDVESVTVEEGISDAQVESCNNEDKTDVTEKETVATCASVDDSGNSDLEVEEIGDEIVSMLVQKMSLYKKELR